MIFVAPQPVQLCWDVLLRSVGVLSSQSGGWSAIFGIGFEVDVVMMAVSDAVRVDVRWTRNAMCRVAIGILAACTFRTGFGRGVWTVK